MRIKVQIPEHNNWIPVRVPGAWRMMRLADFQPSQENKPLYLQGVRGGVMPHMHTYTSLIEKGMSFSMFRLWYQCVRPKTVQKADLMVHSCKSFLCKLEELSWNSHYSRKKPGVVEDGDRRENHPLLAWPQQSSSFGGNRLGDGWLLSTLVRGSGYSSAALENLTWRWG